MLTPLSPSSTIIKSQTFFIITYDISSLKFCIDNIADDDCRTIPFAYDTFELPKTVIRNTSNDSSSKRCRNNLDGTQTDDTGRVVSFVDILYFA